MGSINMKLEELFKIKMQLNKEAADLKENLKHVNAKISEYIQEEFTKSRNNKDEQFGAMSLNIEGLDVKQTVPKKVDWDQVLLADLYTIINDSDDDVKDYIKVKYEVAEKVYGKLTEDKLKFFKPARTEKPGTIKIEVVEKK